MPFRKSNGWGRAKPPPGSALDWGDPISNALVGYWSFAEGGGKIAADAARNHKGSLIADPTWAPGAFGRALTFNGSTQYVSVGSGLYGILKTTPFSMVGWLKTTTTSPVNPWANWNFNTGPGWQAGVNEFVAGTFSVLFINTNGTNYFGRNTTKTVNSGRWTQVAFTHDGSATVGGITLYVNGAPDTPVNQTAGTADPGALTDGAFQIGARQSSGIPNQLFSGSLDNIRKYKRCLKGSEIARLFADPFAGIVAPRRRIISQVASAASDAALASNGAAVASFTASAAQSAPLTAAGTGTAAFSGAAAQSGVISAAGTSTGSFVGTAVGTTDAAFSAAGAATAQFGGASAASAPLTAAGSANGQFVGSAQAAGAADLSVIATSDAQFKAAAAAAGAMEAAGDSDAQFKGEDATPADQTIYGGRVHHARLRRERLKREDEELIRLMPTIMALIEAQPDEQQTVRMDLH